MPQFGAERRNQDGSLAICVDFDLHDLHDYNDQYLRLVIQIKRIAKIIVKTVLIKHFAGGNRVPSPCRQTGKFFITLFLQRFT